MGGVGVAFLSSCACSSTTSLIGELLMGGLGVAFLSSCACSSTTSLIGELLMGGVEGSVPVILCLFFHHIFDW